MKMSNSPSLPCRNKRYLHFEKEKIINPVTCIRRTANTPLPGAEIINIKFCLPQQRGNEIQSKLHLQNCWVSKKWFQNNRKCTCQRGEPLFQTDQRWLEQGKYNSAVKHWMWDWFPGFKFWIFIPWSCKKLLDNYPNFFHCFQQSVNTGRCIVISYIYRSI